MVKVHSKGCLRILGTRGKIRSFKILREKRRIRYRNKDYPFSLEEKTPITYLLIVMIETIVVVCRLSGEKKTWT